MSEMSEKEFIQTEIVRMEGELKTLPAMADQHRKAFDEQIDTLLKEAGILEKVQKIRDQKKDAIDNLKAQGNQVSGAVFILKQLLEKYHTPPPPTANETMPVQEEITHMHGIDLTKLDAEGRAQVIAGNEEVIAILQQSMQSEAEGDDLEEYETLDENEDPEWGENTIEEFLLDEIDQEEAPLEYDEDPEHQVRSLLERYSARDLHE